MAFDSSEAARAKRTVVKFIDRRRPPEEIRDELDLGYQIDRDDQSVQVCEIRPHWKNPDETLETPVAKVKYVKRREVWKLYWVRGDGNWHKYEPAAEVESLENALKIVDEDENHCFWG